MSGDTREAWDRLYSRDDRPWKGVQDGEVKVEGALLELGVGNGKGLSAFTGEFEPIGLDFSRSALLSCRRWHSLPLVQGDVSSLPFRNGCFQFVSASHVLGHLLEPERRKAANEMIRILKDNGGIFVSVFGDQDMRCGTGRQVEELTFERGNGIICHYFRGDEISSLFPGLKVERAWERRISKRYHGSDEVRQELRFLLRP
jgi:SAM-dependent methyltransferase